MYGMLSSAATRDELARRVRLGDASAEDEVVRLYFSWVNRLVARRVRDREAAREIADDVLVEVVQALRAGKVRSPDRLDSFVYGVALNLSNNRVRSAARRPNLEPLVEEIIGFDPVPGYECVELVDICRRALSTLDPLDQQILFLALVEGLKSSEIAARLGLPNTVVRQRKSRARKKVALVLARLETAPCRA